MALWILNKISAAATWKLLRWLDLTVPAVPTVAASTSKIEETPVSTTPTDTVPTVPTLAAPTVLAWQTREFTVTIAIPAVVTCAGHGMANDDRVFLTTTGALPTGLSAGNGASGPFYYVRNKDTDTFNLALTAGGSTIDTSGTQSGTHKCYGTTMA